MKINTYLGWLRYIGQNDDIRTNRLTDLFTWADEPCDTPAECNHRRKIAIAVCERVGAIHPYEYLRSTH